MTQRFNVSLMSPSSLYTSDLLEPRKQNLNDFFLAHDMLLYKLHKAKFEVLTIMVLSKASSNHIFRKQQQSVWVHLKVA